MQFRWFPEKIRLKQVIFFYKLDIATFQLYSVSLLLANIDTSQYN